MKKSRKRIAIIHHQPIEMFPPVINLVEYFSESLSDRFSIYVLTSGTGPEYGTFKNRNVCIKRMYKAVDGSASVKLIYNHALFAIRSLICLLKWRPDVVVYFESHSALTAFLYYRLIGTGSKLFIHYHEYMTPEEYSGKGMRMINFFHKRERYLYTIADWISHTNEKRMELFLQDNPGIRKQICYTLPNYPPKKWASKANIPKGVNYPVKLVYIGSFGSFETLYIKEILHWVSQKPSQFVFDIYSFNITPEVSEFLSGLGADNIHIKGNVEYSHLPIILSKYNVGLILYKATSLNFRFNAPNKLFEYLAVGLDTWFPAEMLGCYPYIRENCYPKVMKVDFTQLSDFNYEQALDRTAIRESRTAFFSENIYNSLADKIAAC